MSLATMDTIVAEEQAKYALVSHVRTRNRGRHGRSGKYPPDFDPDDVLDYIEVRGEDEGRPREIDAIR